MLLSLQDEGAPRPRLLKRSEYDRLVAEGAFVGERLELIHGMIVNLSPQDARHAWIVQRLTALLANVVDERTALRVRLPLALTDHCEPEPDLAVVQQGDYSREHPHSALLVVEVAWSSLRFDRATKGEMYANAGISAYWIVNLVEQRIEVHTQPSGSSYGRVGTYVLGDTIPLDALGVHVAVADIL